jgi:hypothetical protein
VIENALQTPQGLNLLLTAAVDLRGDSVGAVNLNFVVILRVCDAPAKAA